MPREVEFRVQIEKFFGYADVNHIPQTLTFQVVSHVSPVKSFQISFMVNGKSVSLLFIKQKDQ